MGISSLGQRISESRVSSLSLWCLHEGFIATDAFKYLYTHTHTHVSGGGKAFSCQTPLLWNELPDQTQDVDALSTVNVWFETLLLLQVFDPQTSFESGSPG